MAGQAVAHPYVPRDIVLTAYTPNDKGYPEIVGVFFAVVGVVLLVAWLIAGTSSRATTGPVAIPAPTTGAHDQRRANGPCMRWPGIHPSMHPRRTGHGPLMCDRPAWAHRGLADAPGRQKTWTLLDRLTFLWLVACFGIHLILEGYFAINNQTIATDMSFLGQVCKQRLDERRKGGKEKKTRAWVGAGGMVQFRNLPRISSPSSCLMRSR